MNKKGSNPPPPQVGEKPDPPPSPPKPGGEMFFALPVVCRQLYPWAVEWRAAIYDSNVVRQACSMCSGGTKADALRCTQCQGKRYVEVFKGTQECRDEIAVLDRFIETCALLGLNEGENDGS